MRTTGLAGQQALSAGRVFFRYFQGRVQDACMFSWCVVAERRSRQDYCQQLCGYGLACFEDLLLQASLE